MRVDNLKKWTDFRDEVTAISRAGCRGSETADSDGQWSRQRWQGSGRVLTSVTIKLSKHVEGTETRITLRQTALTLTRLAEKRVKVCHLAGVCRSSGNQQPKAKDGGTKGKGWWH